MVTGFPHMQVIDFDELVRCIPNRCRLAMRHAWLQMMLVPIGAGMSHLVALGAEHAVRSAILGNDEPDVRRVYRDCVCTSVMDAWR